MTTRDELLMEMDVAAERFKAAIAGLSDEQMSRQDIDGWCVKDHITHMTFWHEMRFFEVSRIARGGRAGFPPINDARVDPLNEQFVANRHGLPLAQAIADLDFAREMVRQAVSSCPEERLNLSHYEEMGPNGAGHDISHAEIIEAWRKKEGI
jgi:hypothetical protein